MNRKYTTPANIDDVRRRAWITRREKYGDRGHGGSYGRPAASCEACNRMAAALVKLHGEGVLSEGQASKLIGIDRVELRKRVDALINEPCPYCTNARTGLPGNACENCMNTGSANPQIALPRYGYEDDQG